MAGRTPDLCQTAEFLVRQFVHNLTKCSPNSKPFGTVSSHSKDRLAIGLAEKTEDYTGADLAGVASTAVMMALEELVSKYKTIEEVRKHSAEIKVTAKHFEKALEKIKRSGRDGKDLGKFV